MAFAKGRYMLECAHSGKKKQLAMRIQSGVYVESEYSLGFVITVRGRAYSVEIQVWASMCDGLYLAGLLHEQSIGQPARLSSDRSHMHMTRTRPMPNASITSQATRQARMWTSIRQSKTQQQTSW